jgi:hypothetical protein
LTDAPLKAPRWVPSLVALEIKPTGPPSCRSTLLYGLLLYGLLILRQSRRELLWLGVTAHPTAEWLARQLNVLRRRVPKRVAVSNIDHLVFAGMPKGGYFGLQTARDRNSPAAAYEINLRRSPIAVIIDRFACDRQQPIKRMAPSMSGRSSSRILLQTDMLTSSAFLETSIPNTPSITVLPFRFIPFRKSPASNNVVRRIYASRASQDTVQSEQQSLENGA